MEQRHILLSVLSVGVGLGMGLQKWIGGNPECNEISEEQIVMELMDLVIDGKDSNVTFDQFPYYLNEGIRFLLTSAGYVHLRHHCLSNLIRNHSSRAILVSGPAELYHQNLAKALAHCFGSKLLLLDITDFSLQMQNKYGIPRKEPHSKRSISEVTLEYMSGLFGSLSVRPSTSTTGAHLNCTSRLCFNEKLFVQSLYEVLVSISETGSIILYIKDVEKIFLGSPRLYSLFQNLVKNLSGYVLILGSWIHYSEDNSTEVDEQITMLFPDNIEIIPPQDETLLKSWKTQLEEAMKETQLKDSKNYIVEVIAANDIDFDCLSLFHDTDIMLLSIYIEEIVPYAIAYHLMTTKLPKYRNGKLIVSHKSLSHVLNLFYGGEGSGKDNMKTKESNKEVPHENEFEKRIRKEVIPANEIGITFADIGALDDVKESLQEVVMLPLRRPELFKGELLKPCKGVLLFGPPGTGKTMLAKAIANEAGASFINVSMSSITSKWFGDSEKKIRALFSLAAKVAPSVIFIDEVDSMLGKRSRSGEHEVMRKIKNEFMSHWDGLLSKPDERILVLAATNRPFDLDEAIIRRFHRRIMVGLPSAETRETILKTLLAKEKYENIDFKELSTMTEGYTGSDLKNLCMNAAYGPLREIIQQEKAKEMEKKKGEAEVQSSEDTLNALFQEKKKGEADVQSSEDTSNATKDKEDQVITLRPLNMEDMRLAKNKVAASFSAEGSIMNELQQWNDLYGEGGSRKKKHLTYFL